VKLVIGIVRPEKANDVLEALYRAEVRSGGRGHRSPRLPQNPGVTVSRHRALLTSRSERADPPPVGEQAGFSCE